MKCEGNVLSKITQLARRRVETAPHLSRLRHASRILLALWAVEVNWDAEHRGTVLTAAHRVCVVKENVLMWGSGGRIRGRAHEPVCLHL